LATLVGTNPCDQDGLVRAFVQTARVDEPSITALIQLSERYVIAANSAPSAELSIVMRGHLRILDYLVMNSSHTCRRQLREQADTVRQALDLVHRIVR
jgi:hypothetical protein